MIGASDARVRPESV